MLENNIAAIKKYNPDLATAIQNHSIVGRVELEQAQSGDYVLLYEGLPFHSMANPQAEAEQIYNNLPHKSKEAITVIYGLGLGYLFKRISMSFEGRIILYEPNLDILRVTFEAVDFSEELSNDRIILIHRKDDLESAFQKLYVYEDPINLCFLTVYNQLFPDKIKEIMEELAFLKGYFNNNYHTLYSASLYWMISALENLKPIINESIYIDALKDKFRGKPAIIMSGGPSLLKNIDQVREYNDKAVLFSIGGALKKAQKHNVRPDFGVFIDVYPPTHQTEGIDFIDQLNLIMQPSTNEHVYTLDSKRKFVYLASNDYFSQCIAELLKLDIEHFYNRGTVSIAALYAAINFGCDPIILVGSDLAFTKSGQQYADDSMLNIYKPKSEIEVPAADGSGMLPTSGSYASFIRYYENLAKELNGRVRIINATEGGALINGFEHMSFKDAAKAIPNESINVEKTISEALEGYKNPFQTGKMKLVNNLQHQLKSIPKLLTVIKKAKSISSKLKQEIDRSKINKNKILTLFKELYYTNGEMDKIINEDVPFISAFIQKENYAFYQGYGRYNNFNDVNDIKKYLDLAQNYYQAIITLAPSLEIRLDKFLTQKGN